MGGTQMKSLKGLAFSIQVMLKLRSVDLPEVTKERTLRVILDISKANGRAEREKAAKVILDFLESGKVTKMGSYF